MGIVHKASSGPSFKNAWFLKKDLPQSTSSNVEVRKFLVALKLIMQSYSICINDVQYGFEKGKNLETPLNKY